jgi:tetratricopeptide (TPR) repeat protein
VHALYEQHQYPEAASRAQALFSKSASPADAFLLGTILAAQGQHAQAQAAYAKAALADAPELRVKALLAEGHSAQAAGNAAVAQLAFARAARLPGSQKAARDLASTQVRGRPAAAADSAPVRAQRLAEQAYAALASTQSSRAQQLFEQALRLRDDPAWRTQLALAYREQGNLTRARDTLAALQNPSVEQLQQLAAVLFETGDAEGGVQTLGKAARASDRAADYLRLARAAAGASFDGVALQSYRVAQSKIAELPASDQGGLLAELGYSHLRKGELEPAHELLAAAYERTPSSPIAIDIASLEERLGRLDAARSRLARLDGNGLSAQEKQLWYATRARLAQSAGDADEALALLERTVAESPTSALHHQIGLTALAAGKPALAREHLDKARLLDPGNWSADMQLGYLCQSQQDLTCAIAAFERAAAIRTNAPGLAESLAYSYTRQGNNERAVAWFKKAIDAIDAADATDATDATDVKGPGWMQRVSYRGPYTPAAAPAIPASADRSQSQPQQEQQAQDQEQDREIKREALRQQVGTLERQWQLNGYQSHRRRGTQLGDAGIVGGGVIPSQGGLELQVRAPGIGYRDGRIVQLETRLLWGTQPGKLTIDRDTLQGTLGLAVKPFKNLDAFLRVERLVKIGDQSQNNWLVHGSWGAADGWGWHPTKTHWNYSTVYVDAGVMLQNEKTRSVFVEARQGRSFTIASKTVLTPHVVLAMRGQRPDPLKESYVEVGAGVNLKTQFNGSKYVAERSNFEISLQYRKPIAHRPGGLMLTGAVQF